MPRKPVTLILLFGYGVKFGTVVFALFCVLADTYPQFFRLLLLASGFLTSLFILAMVSTASLPAHFNGAAPYNALEHNNRADSTSATSSTVANDTSKETDEDVPPAGSALSQFPDGGSKAWLCVAGGFCCAFASFGWANGKTTRIRCFELGLLGILTCA